mgnify:FL=1
MKLHLPTNLRAALLAGLAATATLATSLGTGTIAGGALIVSLASGSRAQAEAGDSMDDPLKLPNSDGTAGSVTNLNLSSYGENQYIDLNVSGGHLINSTDGNGNIAANIIITQLKLTDGYGNAAYNFSGSISGSGEFSYSKALAGGGQSWDFLGDVSGFTGTINISGNGAHLEELKFTGGGEINAASINVADTLSIGNTTGRSDGTGSSAYATTVTGTVTAGTLNVKGTTDNTFNNTVTVGTLNVDGTATNTFSGAVNATTLNLSGTANFTGVTTSLGTVNLADGSSISGGSATATYLAPNATATIGGNYTTAGLTITAGSTLSIAPGATALVTDETRVAGSIDIAGTGILNLQGRLSIETPTTITGTGTLDLSGLTSISVAPSMAGGITEIRDEQNNITGWTLSYEFLTIDGGITLADGSDAVLTGMGVTNTDGTWAFSETVLVNGWDANWGYTGLEGSPDVASLPTNDGAFSYNEDIGRENDALINCVFIGNKAEYASDGTAAIRITNGTNEANTYIIGGSPSTSTELDTWIYIDIAPGSVDTIGTIVGGNLSNDWSANSTAGNFTGNSHILLKNGTANNIIGGNLRDGAGTNGFFTGNSYITVENGNVEGFVLGAGTTAHSSTNSFIGDTNIWVYTVLTTGDTTLKIDASAANNTTNLSAEFAAVAGGGATARNVNGTIAISGNTSVTIDLSDYAGSNGSEFGKYVVGSSIAYESGATVRQTGDASVSIISRDGLTFRDAIIGGHFNPYRASSLTLTGNSSVAIDASAGGTFSHIVGGSYLGETATAQATHAGNSSVEINGGANAVFLGSIIGGSMDLMAAGSAKLVDHQGDTSVTIKGDATFSGGLTLNGDQLAVIGGTYVKNYTNGEYTKTKNSTVDISGGSFDGLVVTGSVVPYRSTTTISGVNTLKISGGTFNKAVIGGVASNGGGYASNITFSSEETDIDVQITGGRFASGADIIGGSYLVEAAGDNKSTFNGTIQLAVSGATVDSNIYGGTYIEGNSPVVQKDVELTLGNSEGTTTAINGSVYAAGYAEGDAAFSTEDTKVTIAQGVSFGGSADAPITISGGYGGSGANATVTGSKTLAATGGSVDLSGNNIILSNFTTADVAEGSSLNLGSKLATAGITTKTGAGTLAIAGDMTGANLRVEGGTLQVGNATVLGSLAMATDTTLKLTASGADALHLSSLVINDGASIGLDLTGLTLDTTQSDYTLVAFDSEQSLDLSRFDIALGDGWTGELSLIDNKLVLTANQFLYWDATDVPGVWTATDEDNFFTGGSGSAATWVSGSGTTLVFGESSEAKDVSIEGGLEVADMIVQAGAGNTYSFTVSNGAITSLGNLTVESGSASFGAGALAVTSETDVTVSNGATLSLADKGTSTDGKLNIAMEGGSTLVWAGSSDVLEGNSLALGEGTVTLNIGSNDTSLAGLTNTAGSALTEATTIAVAGSGSVTLADDSIGSAGLDMGTGTTLAGAQHAANNAIAGAGSVGIDADTAWNGANKTYSGATNIADGVTVTAQGGISSGNTAVSLGEGSTLVLADGNRGFGSINTGTSGTVVITTNGDFESNRWLCGSGTICVDLSLTDSAGSNKSVEDIRLTASGFVTAAIPNAGNVTNNGAPSRFTGTYLLSGGQLYLDVERNGKLAMGLDPAPTIKVESDGQLLVGCPDSGNWTFNIDLTGASSEAIGAITGQQAGLVLDITGNTAANFTGSLTMQDGSSLASIGGASEFSGAVTLGKTAEMRVENGTVTLSGSITQEADGSLSKTGSGTLKFATSSAANIALDAGTLDLGAASIGASVTAADGTAINASVDSTLASLTVSGGATTLTGNATTLTSLSGSGTVDVQNDLTINGGDFAGTLEMNGDTGSLTLGAAEVAADATIELSNANATLQAADDTETYLIGSLTGTGTVAAGKYQVSAGGEFSGTLASGADLTVAGGELKLGSNTAAEAEIRLTGASLGMASSVGEDEVVSIRNLTADGSSTLNAGRYVLSGANSAFAGKLSAGVQLTVASGATLNLEGVTIQPGGPINIIGEGGSTINELRLWSGITLHASNTGEDSQVSLSGGMFLGGSVQFDMTKVSDGEDGVPVYAPSTTAAYNGGGDLFIFGQNNLILNPGTGVSIQNGTYTLIENVGELEEKELGYLVLNYSSWKRLRHDLSLEQNGSQYDLVLTVSGEARSLTWQGDASGAGNWSYTEDLDPNQPWTYTSGSGTAASDFSNGEAVTFDTLEGITGPAVVNVTTDVIAGSIVVKGDTSYTWTTENGSTVSTVAGGKLEVGTADEAFNGTLRLETETAIAGGVDINSGTVVAAHSWALKDSVVTVNKDATLKVDQTAAGTKIFASSITMNDGSRLAATGNAGGTVNNVATNGAVSLAGEGDAVLNLGLSSISSDSVLTTDGTVNINEAPKDASFAALIVNSGTTKLDVSTDLIVDRISGDGTLQVEGVLTSASSSLDIAHLAVNYGYMYSTAAEGTTVASLTTVSHNGTFFGTWTLENLADGADMNVGSLTSASNTASLTINQAKDATINVGYGSSLMVESNATISSISTYYGGATVTLADDTTVGSLILESDSFAHYPANELNTATADGTITVTGSATIEKTTVNAAELVLMGNASLDLNTTVSTLTVSGQDSVTDEASGTVTPGTTVALGGTEIGHLLLESGTVATTSSTRVSLIEMSGGTLDFCGNNIGIAPPSTPDAPEPISMYGDIVMTGGSLARAERYRGLIIINDAIGQTFEMGGLSDEATLMLQNAEGTQLTGLTGLTLGDGSLITISAGMTSEAGALLQFSEQGTAGVAENATVTFDINDVLGIVRSAENQSATFTLGNGYADLSDLNSAVTFDASLYLMNMQAEFTQDGKLTLTQLSPSDPDTVYIASEAQGSGNAAWAGNGDRLIYNSTEGYTVVYINQDTTIDLVNGLGLLDPAEIPAGKTDVGLALPNLIGSSGTTLTIVGDNDGTGTKDLVSIVPNLSADELPNNVRNALSFGGTIKLQGTDLKLMAADAATSEPDSEFVYRVGSLQADEHSQVIVQSGVLQLDSSSTLSGGLSVDENGQLALRGDTTLSGAVTGTLLSGTDKARADVSVGSGRTLTLDDAELAGISIAGEAGSVMSIASDSSLDMSSATSGLLLSVEEGAALSIVADQSSSLTTTYATEPTPGVLEYEGLVGKGSLVADASAAAEIVLNTASGTGYIFEGSLADYNGTITLKGEGTQAFTQDAAATSFRVTGGNLVLADTVSTVGSLQLSGTGQAYVNLVDENNTGANRTFAVKNELRLGEGSTLNLTLNLTQAMLDGTAAITSTSASYTGGSVSLNLVGMDEGLDLTGGETVTATLISSVTTVTDTEVSLARPEDKLLQKYFGNTARVEVQGNNLVLTGTTVTAETADFHASAALTQNGRTGAAMLDDLYATTNPQLNAPGSVAASVLNELEQMILAGDNAAADRRMAAVAGASATAMGMAFAGDVQRQLKAIRNRTTTMGVNDAYVNPDMPYFNAWVNAEGSYRSLEQDSTYAGYEFNSWGGTLGFDADITPNWTAGLALTAMYGSLTAKSAEMAEGDLNTYYVTAFARYTPSAWAHTFVASVGMADASLDRTVSYSGGSYRTGGDTDGYGFGLMYELGYTVPLDEDGQSALQPVFNITYTHSNLGAYSESGDMAVRFGDQTMDTLTLGLGLRAQTTIGENIYNRTSLLEGRVLAKCDIGDRSSSASAALAALGHTAGEVESAEVGAFGVELGAGLTVPVGQEGGSLFFDASLELRADYTNVNATVGYRINF